MSSLRMEPDWNKVCAIGFEEQNIGFTERERETERQREREGRRAQIRLDEDERERAIHASYVCLCIFCNLQHP